MFQVDSRVFLLVRLWQHVRRCKGNGTEMGWQHRWSSGSCARFRRPHVLHADVGELTLHLALLDLKLAWSLVQAMKRVQKNLNFERKTQNIAVSHLHTPC